VLAKFRLLNINVLVIIVPAIVCFLVLQTGAESCAEFRTSLSYMTTSDQYVIILI
jgi:hypothetical protein